MTVEVNAIETVVELPRLAQSEEPGGTGGEARGRGGLGEELWLRCNPITSQMSITPHSARRIRPDRKYDG